MTERWKQIIAVAGLILALAGLSYCANQVTPSGTASYPLESPERLARIEAMAENWPKQPDFSQAFDPRDPQRALTTESTVTAASAAQPSAQTSAQGPSELPFAADGTHDFVAGYCGACHSIDIVRQQHVTRERWGELLDWMEQRQGMPALSPDDEKRVLDYLSQHFGPTA